MKKLKFVSLFRQGPGLDWRQISEELQVKIVEAPLPHVNVFTYVPDDIVDILGNLSI